jgi:hypothetical protein
MMLISSAYGIGRKGNSHLGRFQAKVPAKSRNPQKIRKWAHPMTYSWRRRLCPKTYVRR